MHERHPVTGRSITSPGSSNAYVYNAHCACDICANGGVIPAGHAETGHAFCYGLPHVPPSRYWPGRP